MATIAGLPLMSPYYEASIELLENRFGNKQVTIAISSHMDSLLILTPIGNSSDCKPMMAHVRGLQALHIPSETYDTLLVPVVMKKIPEDIRLLVVGCEMKDGEWNLVQILRLLQNEVENATRTKPVQLTDNLQRIAFDYKVRTGNDVTGQPTACVGNVMERY